MTVHLLSVFAGFQLRSGAALVQAVAPAYVVSRTMSKPARRLVVLDGPMGTELSRRGVDLPLPEWSAQALETSPRTVAAIHRDYAAAGATVHTANTFRTQRRAVGSRWEKLAAQAVAIARESVPRGHLVAGSIAPLEDCYRPERSPGRASGPEHLEMASALASLGVDLLLCETFPAAVEAAVAVEAAAGTGVETWVALTAGPDGDLMTPAALAAAARACVDAGARAVLVNCLAARRTLVYVRELAAVGVPFGAYANAGGPEEGIGWDAAGDSRGAELYAKLAQSWLDAGATILGGCCGTGPSHIEKLSALASRRRDRS
jgi:S-methylmethionine-dependent homocysteine/selenocysteine methylase